MADMVNTYIHSLSSNNSQNNGYREFNHENVSKLTRIRHFDDLGLLDPRQLGARLEGLELQHAEEVRDEADEVLAHGVVEVDKVLDAQVAAVERQHRRAETLDQLQKDEQDGCCLELVLEESTRKCI